MQDRENTEQETQIIIKDWLSTWGDIPISILHYHVLQNRRGIPMDAPMIHTKYINNTREESGKYWLTIKKDAFVSFMNKLAVTA